MRLLALGILLIVCSAHSSKPESVKVSTIGFKEKGRVDNFIYKKRTIQVTDENEAKNISRNKIDYLRLYFQPSIDPYFGKDASSEVCIKNTDFIEPIHDSEGFWRYARVPTNESWEVGCKVDGNSTLLLIRYCKKSNLIQEIWLKEVSGKPLAPKGFECSGSLLF